MGSGWGPTITITQDAARLSVEYAFFSRGDMQPPLRFVYALDGSETKNAVMMGQGIQVQPARTKWDGDRLVITTTHSFTDPGTGKPLTIDVTQTLSLESPTSLVVATTRAGVLGGPATSTRTVYRKM
jgi:arylsulfatase